MTKFIFCFIILHLVFTSQGSERYIKNIRDFHVLPVSNSLETDLSKKKRYDNINVAFLYCIKNGCDLFFPEGVYDVGERNFPFRNNLNSNFLLDCKGLKVFGTGEGTVFMTNSTNGADVLQLNKIKNISFENLAITAVLKTKNRSGSNGISITNGFDNIVLNNLTVYNLPGIDVIGGVDGSKGLTIQAQSNKLLKLGKLFANNIKVKNCAYGFRLDTNFLDDIISQQSSLDIQIKMTANDCYQGISIAFGKARKNIPSTSKLKIKIDATLTDCQQYVRFSRVFGGIYNISVNKSKNYKSKNWVKSDKLSLGFLSNYSKNVGLNMEGNLGRVDKKVIIGAVGSIIEPYSSNSTDNSNFYFDLDGTSDTEFEIIEHKGKSINNSSIKFSSKVKTNSNMLNSIRKGNKITVQ